MKNRDQKNLLLNLIDSFNYAINGIIVAVKTERNMKIHYTAAVLVLFISLFFDFSKLEFLFLVFAIVLVIITELINTAIEKTIDMVSPEYNRLAEISKDMAAGAVLVAALNSLVVAYVLFFDRLDALGTSIIFRINNSPMHLTVVAILLVLVLTLGLKAFFRKYSPGSHLQGGAVSGHASLAFCSATIISVMAENTIVTILAFIMALLVGQSRIEGKIHTLLEVVSGAVLGSLIGILIFQVL